MPPRKRPKSLVDLTIDSLTLILSTKYRSQDEFQKSDNSLECIRNLLECLPVPLLEQLITRLTYLLIGKDRQMSPFYSSFISFPLQNVTQLDFSRLFHGFRLKRNQNTAFKDFCVSTLKRTIHLTKLVLIGKCTDKILEVLGTTCHSLRELNIALSDDVTDQGLQELVKRSACDNGDRCPRLRLLDVTKCWNISPVGVAEMIQLSPSLRRLCYFNMRALARELARRSQEGTERSSFEVDYFECTDPKPQDLSVLKQGIVFDLFPRISTLKLLISDEDVGALISFTGLQHVELELENYPGAGFSNFFKHHSSSDLCQLVLQVNSMTADCLQMIAENCRKLKVFKFTGTTLIGEERLTVSSKCLNQLTHVEFKLYNSEGLYSSDEDEDGAGSPEIHPQIFDFFLQNSPYLIQVTFHVNCYRFMNLNYLSRLLADNPLVACEKLSLDGPVPLPLDRSAIELVLSSLPAIKSLHVSRWEGVTDSCMAAYRRDSKAQNLDIEFY